MNLNERQRQEREFWDESPQLAEERSQWDPSGFEDWSSRPIHSQAVGYLQPLAGKRLLLCSVGAEVVPLAQAGAEVYGFDISDAQAAAGREVAARAGVSERVTIRTMPFEALDFPDDFFDAAFGQSVIHHVELEAAGRELHRVLKAGSRGSFIEPLGMNPALEFARRHLPYHGKHRSLDEQPLTYAEIHRFGQPFSRLTYREYSLLSMLRGRVITHEMLNQLLYKMDEPILRHIPPVRRFSRQIWIGVEVA